MVNKEPVPRRTVPLIVVNIDELLRGPVYQPVNGGSGVSGSPLCSVSHRDDRGIDCGSVRSVNGRANNGDRTDIVRAKDLMSMTALLDMLVPTWKKKNPLREDDRRNSFGADELGWMDHGTLDKGDQITFLERLYGIDRGEGIRRFLELAGVEVPRMPGRAPKLPTIDWAACVVAFTGTKAEELAKYRGYSPDFVSWLKAQNLIGIYRDDRGVDQLAFPVHSDRGDVVGVHHKHSAGNWRTVGGASKPLIIGDKTAAKWLVFESQWDAFAVMEALDYHLDGCLPPCTILITRGGSNGKFTSIIPADAEVTIVMQNDEEKNGKKQSEVWLETIKSECPARLRVARPPLNVKDANDWLNRGDADFQGMLARAQSTALRGVSVCDMTCEVHDDSDELLKHRFLCRGGSAMINGPTGVGKSSLLMQGAILWALGRPLFGIEPARCLTSLIVQAENDDGDLVEQREGVFTGLGLTEVEKSLVRERVFIYSENSKTGATLVNGLLRPLLREHRPDLLWLDNLFAYCGCGVSDQKEMTAFLRTLVNPVIQEHRCGIIIAHHTNKPPMGNQRADHSDLEAAYMGSGTGELANWPRATLSIRELKTHGIFELIAGKRGSRLGWKDEQSKSVSRRRIAHSSNGLICWRDADPDAEPATAGVKKKHFVEDILLPLGDQHLGAVAWQVRCKEEQGIGSTTFYDLKKLAEKSNLIASDDGGKWFKVV